MQVLTAIDPNQAVGQTRELFDSLQQRQGRVPNMLRIMGNSPAVLESYMHFTNAFQKGTMTARLRSLMTAAIAELTGGDYIMAFNYVLAKREGIREDDLAVARRLQSADAKTQSSSP